MAIQDVIVTIDIKRPAAKIGLGRPLILAAGTAESTYKEYNSIEKVKADFPEGTSVYKKAKAVFDQVNKPDKVCVATYNPNAGKVPSGGGEPEQGLTITDALERYFDKPWHFLIVPDATITDRLAVSNKLQPHSFKFLVLKVENKEELEQYKLNSRTILYYHPDKPSEEIDAAIIGDAGSITVGSITWKFRQDLVGITPIEISADELNEIHELHANAYIEKVGKPQTSEGYTATGEYIDVLHGQDWVKANAESSLQTMLMDNAKENKKVPSNDTGISMAASVFTNVLTEAAVNGIIDKDKDGNARFTVSTASFDEIPQEDRMKRIYSGLSFEYYPEGAVHGMKVRGVINEE